MLSSFRRLRNVIIRQLDRTPLVLLRDWRIVFLLTNVNSRDLPLFCGRRGQLCISDRAVVARRGVAPGPKQKNRCGRARLWQKKVLPPRASAQLEMSAGFEGTQKRISLRLLLTDIISQMDRPARVLLRDWRMASRVTKLKSGDIPRIMPPGASW